MAAEQSTGKVLKDQSPIEKLNDKLESNNNDIFNLLERLTTVGGRISANMPEPEPLQNGKDSPGVPFNEGVLMQYYYSLNRQEQLISQLINQICKLEGLF